MNEVEPGPHAPPIVDFAGLYQAHSGALRRFAVGLSGDPSLADDIVSETFIRMWSARARLDLVTVRAYLFAIARNVFLKTRQREAKTTTLDEQLADRQPNPETHTQSRRELEVVLKALQGLPEIDRAAVLMRADDETSYEEIAKALGISTVAARVKVHRARFKLAEARLAGTTPEPIEEMRR